ncbi:MAG: hypothetical protein HQL90_16025 [Magnetococcales bacterium]|nr:hypothetical protein [Magnetococcales bacterium]
MEDVVVSGTVELNIRTLPLLLSVNERGMLNGPDGEAILDEELTDGSVRKFSLTLPRSPSVLFAKDWGYFLLQFENQFRLPQGNFDFLVDEQENGCYWHKNGQRTKMADAYFDTLSCIDFLQSAVADHVQKAAQSGLTLIFWTDKGEKLEILVRYGAGDMRPLPAVGALRQTLDTAPHKKEKHGILKRILAERLRNDQPDARFVRLLERLDEIRERLNVEYQTFIREFSFDKIREEVEDRKLEYMVKLNNAISDIQNKFLAVPIALLLASGQMENVHGWSIKNSLVLFGAVAFTIILQLLLRNQRHTLDAVKSEIDGKAERLKEKHQFLFEKIETAFSALDKRYTNSLTLLRFMSTAIWVGLVISIGVFSFYTFY